MQKLPFLVVGVRVTLDGKNYKDMMMLVDTGASNIIFREKSIVEKFAVDVAELRDGAEVQGICIEKVKTKQLPFAKIEALGHFVLNQTARVLESSMPFDGLLGTQFLEATELKVNYPKGIISLKRA
jgi:predicted aspartyl protease